MTRAGSDQRSSFSEADLALIEGIDRLTAERLVLLGIKSFADIAAWTTSDVERWRTRLGLDHRTDTESWIEQARKLAAGVETVFAARVRRGEIAAFGKPARRPRRRAKGADTRHANGEAAPNAPPPPTVQSLMQRLEDLATPPAPPASPEPHAGHPRRAAFRGIVEEATIEIIRHQPRAPAAPPSETLPPGKHKR